MTKTLTFTNYGGKELTIMEFVKYLEGRWVNETFTNYKAERFFANVLLGDLSLVRDLVERHKEMDLTKEVEAINNLCSKLGHIENPISDYCKCCSEDLVGGNPYIL